MDKTKICVVKNLLWKTIFRLSPSLVNQFATWDFVKVDTLKVAAL